jgi:NAD(P)-dependent dehydrogenase (short-subunit alcohol dehydrogenase family)
MVSLSGLMNLGGRRALVTGATGHLGKVICATLAELGSNLVLVDQPGAALKDLEDTLRADWEVNVASIPCNLEEEQQRTELATHIKVHNLELNCLVNNAAFVGTTGLAGWATTFEQQSLDSWRRAIEVNLTASFHLSQLFAPMLRKSEGGNIVNVGSIYGELGPDWRLYDGTSLANPAAYSASKGGLLQLTRWLATTLAPDIRVNAISPGGIFRAQPSEFVERYISRTPLQRMATENDMRGAVAFFTSDMASYVTGETLRVDGGWGAW